METMTEETRQRMVRAIQQVANAIEETAIEAGTLGAPSGPMYAAISAATGCGLDVYQGILAQLEKAGRIRVSGHVVFAGGK